MNNELYNSIQNFNIDGPISEYGFSTRLAAENFWTKNFTEKAITEYKKFMYLAAISEYMVSPSPIVDIVWHQHIIYTQSYAEFCKLIGKNIQHIPSTHNRATFEKFKLARERTDTLYEETFGKQPVNFWNCADMYEPLNQPKAKFKIRSFIIIGILASLALVVPFYYLLRPVYVHINNPLFLLSYIFLIIVTFIGLHNYNETTLLNITRSLPRDSFLFYLKPIELMYIQTQRIEDVIHCYMNKLIDEKKINIKNHTTIQLNDAGSPDTVEEFTILDTLKYFDTITYRAFLSQMVKKPVFNNIPIAMNAFKKYLIKSKAFVSLFCINFIILAFVFLLGFIRLTTGILRDKPVVLISIVLIIFFFAIVGFLMPLSQVVYQRIISKFYKSTILPYVKEKEAWDWAFFTLGTAAFSPSFLSLYKQTITTDRFSGKSSSNSNSGSSCSSCGGGSSCGGSSCGGCGGGD